MFSPSIYYSERVISKFQFEVLIGSTNNRWETETKFPDVVIIPEFGPQSRWVHLFWLPLLYPLHPCSSHEQHHLNQKGRSPPSGSRSHSHSVRRSADTPQDPLRNSSRVAGPFADHASPWTDLRRICQLAILSERLFKVDRVSTDCCQHQKPRPSITHDIFFSFLRHSRERPALFAAVTSNEIRTVHNRYMIWKRDTVINSKPTPSALPELQKREAPTLFLHQIHSSRSLGPENSRVKHSHRQAPLDHTHIKIWEKYEGFYFYQVLLFDTRTSRVSEMMLVTSLIFCA